MQLLYSSKSNMEKEKNGAKWIQRGLKIKTKMAKNILMNIDKHKLTNK